MPLFPFPRKRAQAAGVTGLALAPEGAALARVERRGDQPPRLTLCEFRECRTDERPAVLAALVRDQRAGIRGVSVMEGDGFSLLLVEAPQVDPTELKAAVRWRIRDLIDFHIDDAVIDVFDIPGQQERGRPKLMYVVAARASVVQQHIGLIEGAGIDLSAIDIPELCQRNIAALLPEDSSGVALLHLGHRRGLLTLTRQGSLYLSRTLDVGASQLLNASIEGPAALERLVDGIVLEVQRSLDYYESHFSLPPLGALVVAPMEQNVTGLIGMIARNLGIPVRMLDLTSVLDSERTISEAHQARCFLAVGAALRREEKAL